MGSHSNCHTVMKMIKSTPTPSFPLVEKKINYSQLIAPSSSTIWETRGELMNATMPTVGSLLRIKAFSKMSFQTKSRTTESKWFRSILRRVRNLKRDRHRHRPRQRYRNNNNNKKQSNKFNLPNLLRTILACLSLNLTTSE